MSVDGSIVTRPAHTVAADSRLAVTSEAQTDAPGGPRWVSRSAHKLAAALDAFAIDARGRIGLDVGASTGGFTQVLLHRGAERVIAVDVGHGQLAPGLAHHPQVVSLEGINARDLDPATLALHLGDRTVDLVVVDVSFISLRLVLQPITAVVADGADIVVLIKPQFEVGRARVRGGVVRDPAHRRDAILGVLDRVAELGLGCRGLIASPIDGTHGNAEFLAHLAADDSPDPTQWMHTATTLTGADS